MSTAVIGAPGTTGTTGATAVVTGVGLALAGADSVHELAERWETGPADGAEPFDPAARIGRKGLRYKDRATRLAYSAARDALDRAGLLGTDGTVLGGARTAVVASSNFGNLDTVCTTVGTIAAESAAAVSPMALPNASSNVVASSVAIRFGLGGPNLMLCNGETSGTDAVHWATLLLAAGRADRALVIGVEPDTEPVRRLTGSTAPFDGAVALLLEPAGADSTAPVLARIGGHARAATSDDCGNALAAGAQADGTPAGREPAEPAPAWRAASGALGVLQCAAAIGRFAAGDRAAGYAVTGGRAAGGAAGLVLLPPGEPS